MSELSQGELLDWLEEKLEYIESRKRKPGHGVCCTCQRCGHVYDDCLCGDKEFYQQIKEMIQSQGNLEQNMARGKGKVTEEFIERWMDTLSFSAIPLRSGQIDISGDDLIRMLKEAGVHVLVNVSKG